MIRFYAQLNHYRIKLLNQLYGHIKVSIYIYVLLKYINMKRPALNSTVIKCLALIISPIMFTIIWLFKITTCLVALWLRLTETDYFKMLDGMESMFIVQETIENRAIITTLILVEHNQSAELSSDEFYDICLKNIVQTFSKETFTKLQCSIQYKFGYAYMKKEKMRLEECVTEFSIPNVDGNTNTLEEKTLTMEQLRFYVSEVCNQAMPQNDSSLWEARIGKQNVTGTNLYPLIFRFHHIVGDAITIFNIFSVDFQHNHQINLIPNILTKTRPLDVTYTQDPFITMNGLVDPPDSNALCQANGEKHVVWYTEENPNILNTIKEIKQKRASEEAITVVDVMLTCFTESLVSHFERLNVKLPQIVYTVLPMMPPNNKLASYCSVTNYKLSNKISLAFLMLPIKLPGSNKEKSLINRLNIIKDKYNKFKNVSLDYWCNRWQATVLITILPWFIKKWFVMKYAISLTVSNIPGCESLVFFDRLKVKECVMIDPNFSISGVTLMITSYENRLNFAYTIDKAVIPNVEDVKKISNDFMVNLAKLKKMAT